MLKKTTPSYYGLRIFITSYILFFFLAIPFMSFLAFRAVPRFAEEFGKDEAVSGMTVDSLKAAGILSDSLAIGTDTTLSQDQIDSIVERAVEKAEAMASGKDDPASMGSGPEDADEPGGEEEEESGNLFGDRAFDIFFSLLFFLTLLSYLLGFIYNWPLKRFFKRTRKGSEVSDKLLATCRKRLFRTPVVNGLIITLPFIVLIIYSVIFIISAGKLNYESQGELFMQFFYLSIVTTLLMFLFVYYWQKHRVHIRYIDFLFSPEELRNRMKTGRKGTIRNRLVIASGMTTFLPLMIVLVYLVLSITSIKDLELDQLTPEKYEILFGEFGQLINQGEPPEVSSVERFFYVNAADSIVMLVGIGNGIIVSLIYLLLFIKWVNQDITTPVKELLQNMRKTRGGDEQHYTIVRTNDEIGELAEGYNEMTMKIQESVERISRMNRELEEKVRERTREVIMQKEEIESQKEEIEAQKEEIEAQLDHTTLQRDTISRQKELIIDSIRYAEKIQKAILPPLDLLSEEFPDHFVLFKPRDIVSGDYYWTSRVNGNLLIAVADCTGHGVPGGFLSMLGVTSLNEIVTRTGLVNPHLILDRFRDQLIDTLHQKSDRRGANDGIEIALCTIDREEQLLDYSGANRPIYLVREKNGKEAASLLEEMNLTRGSEDDVRLGESDTHWLLQLRPDRSPIGLYEQDPVPFSSLQTPLRKNDTLYMFSDGYVDQLGGPSRKTFRARRFRELLLEIQHLPMSSQKKLLTENYEQWRGEVEQIDDILVVGIRI